MKQAETFAKAKKMGIEVLDAKNGCFIFKSTQTGKQGSAWLEDGEFGLVRFHYSNGEDPDWCRGINHLFKKITRK
jgi:hypothetical protein